MQDIAELKKWLGNGSINIFGWPFSGKDTQGRKLAKLLDAQLIGGGEIYRSTKDIPEDVKKLVNAGVLAPQDHYLSLVTPYLSRPEYQNRPIIMSSLGRWHGEEEPIMAAAQTAGHPIKGVVYLDLDEATARQRWNAAQKSANRGPRADDAAEHLQTRFDEFRHKTLPVIDFYKSRGLLSAVDGKAPPEEVTRQILEKLSRLANA